jgi:hypothetical protein
MGGFVSAYFQYENPFDFLASLIARLPELDPELYYHPDKRNALPDIDRWSTSAHTLLVTSPEFSVDGLLRYGMQTDTVNQLNAWCTQDPDFPHIFSMACELDHILFWENILMSPYVTVDLKDGFKALNENAEETGILILPRVPSLNDPLDRADLDPDGNHKTWASDWEAGINEELTNTYYIRRDDFAVMNWRYVAEHRVVRNLVVGKQICLAFSPIAKRAQLLDPHCCKLEEGCRFSVPGLRDPELIHARVRAAYKAASQEKADILIFPEMLGDAAMFDPDKTYSEFFTSLGNGPALILPPTWWHDNRNQLYVLTGDGEQLCVQEKQNPFLYRPDGQDQGYLEDLRDTQSVVQVLHVPYVGRITFPICKDYLVPDYRGLLVKVLRSTLMLCPSYSQ